MRGPASSAARCTSLPGWQVAKYSKVPGGRGGRGGARGTGRRGGERSSQEGEDEEGGRVGGPRPLSSMRRLPRPPSGAPHTPGSSLLPDPVGRRPEEGPGQSPGLPQAGRSARPLLLLLFLLDRPPLPLLPPPGPHPPPAWVAMERAWIGEASRRRLRATRWRGRDEVAHGGAIAGGGMRGSVGETTKNKKVEQICALVSLFGGVHPRTRAHPHAHQRAHAGVVPTHPHTLLTLTAPGNLALNLRVPSQYFSLIHRNFHASSTPSHVLRHQRRPS